MVDWKLIFKNKDSDSIEINSWIVSQQGFTCKFKTKDNCKITSSDLCSASKVISVGGYVVNKDSLLLSSHTGKGIMSNSVNSPSCISPFNIEISNNKSADGTSFSAPLIVRTITKNMGKNIQKYQEMKSGST